MLVLYSVWAGLSRGGRQKRLFFSEVHFFETGAAGVAGVVKAAPEQGHRGYRAVFGGSASAPSQAAISGAPASFLAGRLTPDFVS
jgi:hypothetical protein